MSTFAFVIVARRVVARSSGVSSTANATAEVTLIIKQMASERKPTSRSSFRIEA